MWVWLCIVGVAVHCGVWLHRGVWLCIVGVAVHCGVWLCIVGCGCGCIVGCGCALWGLAVHCGVWLCILHVAGVMGCWEFFMWELVVVMVMVVVMVVSHCSVEWLVLDEADKLFEPGTLGFRDQVSWVGKKEA